MSVAPPGMSGSTGASYITPGSSGGGDDVGIGKLSDQQKRDIGFIAGMSAVGGIPNSDLNQLFADDKFPFDGAENFFKAMDAHFEGGGEPIGTMNKSTYEVLKGAYMEDV